MSFEYLPTEIVLQIFTYFSLRELLATFFGLNYHIDSMIRLVRDISHVVKYKDEDAINLLHLFPTSIIHLIFINAENANFLSLNNLRSLTLKYGTETQFGTIRPQHFPLLEILHIKGNNLSQTLIRKVD